MTIGYHADQDEGEPDRDVDGGFVDRLLALERRRPAHDPRAEERRARALRAYRPAVADEEAGDEQEGADEVEADGESPIDRAAAEQSCEQRERRDRKSTRLNSS